MNNKKLKLPEDQVRAYLRPAQARYLRHKKDQQNAQQPSLAKVSFGEYDSNGDDGGIRERS